MAKLWILFSIGSLLLMSSCKQAYTDASEQTTVFFKTDTKSYKAGKDCGLQDSLISECATLNINRLTPVSNNEVLNKAVNDTLTKYIYRMIGDCIFSDDKDISERHHLDLDSLSNLYFAQHRDFVKEFPDAGVKIWNIDINVDSIHQNARILCVSVSGFTFLGGAHPNTFVTYHNFDKSTGKTLIFADFIQDLQAFTKIAETAFRKNQELAENQDLEEAGYFFENGKYSLPTQYAITEEGLMLFYNAYEAAAYVVGQISFTIPYESLTGIADIEKIK